MNSSSALPTTFIISRDLIHRRYGHLHEDGLLKLDKLGVDGVWGFSLLPPPPSPFVQNVQSGSQECLKLTNDPKGTRTFHFISYDIWGPMSTEDMERNIWYLEGIYYKTFVIFGNVMKHKSDSTSTWKSMISSVKSLGHMISRLRIDNGTALLSKEFTLVCETEGVAEERIVPYSLSQLGMIERQWGTLVDGAKTLLLVAKLLDRFLGHPFHAMVYIRNRYWLSGSNGVPLELVTGKAPNLSNLRLRVFGCPTYVHIDVSLRKKFGYKAWKDMFVGYAFDSPTWLVRLGIGYRLF